MLKIIAFLIIVLLDQATKILAITKLKPIGTYDFIPGILHLTYVENTGAAFSILKGQTLFLIVIPIIICLFISYILLTKRIKHPLGVWSLIAVVSGAVGNLIDRIFRGAVVDFFEIRIFEFAVFNVADIFVSVGAILLLIYIIFIADKKDETL